MKTINYDNLKAIRRVEIEEQFKSFVRRSFLEFFQSEISDIKPECIDEETPRAVSVSLARIHSIFDSTLRSMIVDPEDAVGSDSAPSNM